MSLTFLSSLNKPPIVVAAGAVIAAGFPLVPVLSVGVLQVANVLAFATNVYAVSVPGRMDGGQDRKMRQGDLNPTPTPESTTLLRGEQHHRNENEPVVVSLRERTLVRPAGWAFAIWAPVYLGEATFCVAQFVEASNLAAVLPQMSVPFVAANLLQSLWCASFRASYNEASWHKYVSCAMLGGTAYALSYIPTDSSWFFLPMAMHFGWTTAATLVNLNGSLAMDSNISDSAMVGVGHASAVLATALGVGVTVFEWSTPAYGLTVAWALAAVANGTKLDVRDEHEHDWSDALQTGARVQRALCWTGAVLCATAAGSTFLM
jgi:hypothetical protein